MTKGLGIYDLEIDRYDELCHGGPIAEPEDAQYILDHTEGIVGFYGASSMERLPAKPFYGIAQLRGQGS